MQYFYLLFSLYVCNLYCRTPIHYNVANNTCLLCCKLKQIKRNENTWMNMVQYEHGATSTIADFFYFYNITIHHNFWKYNFLWRNWHYIKKLSVTPNETWPRKCWQKNHFQFSNSKFISIFTLMILQSPIVIWFSIFPNLYVIFLSRLLKQRFRWILPFIEKKSLY